MNVTEKYSSAALLENQSPVQASVMSQHTVKSFRFFLYAKIWGGQSNIKIDNLFLAVSSSSFSFLSPEKELLLFCLHQKQVRGVTSYNKTQWVARNVQYCLCQSFIHEF